MSATRLLRLAPLAASLLVACENETVAPLPPTTATQQLVIDATSDVAFAGVRLGRTATLVSPVDTTSATTWDLAFRTTTARLNSGLGGPGTVRVVCLCRNQALTTAQLQALDTAAERLRFERITADSAPADSLFRAETFAPAVAGWFIGSGTTLAANPGRRFGFRRPAPAGSAHPWLYSKLEFQSITPGSPTRAIVRYATQTTPLSAWPADIVDTITLGTTPEFLRLTTTLAGTATEHDLRITATEIRLGPGVNAATFVTGSWAAVNAVSTDPAQSNPDLSNPNARWLRDATTNPLLVTVPGNAAASSIWYRYDASLLQVFSRFEVYLVRTPNGLFKVQPVSYYNAAGRERFITLRYARLAN